MTDYDLNEAIKTALAYHQNVNNLREMQAHLSALLAEQLKRATTPAPIGTTLPGMFGNYAEIDVNKA